jgi:transmembrane sensor
MENQQEKDLINKYLAGLCTDDEKTIVESWYLSYAQKEAIQPGELNESDYRGIESEMWKAIEKRNRPAVRSIGLNIGIAATILLFLSFGSYLLFHKAPIQQVAKNQTHDIAPGGNKAILTLANGEKISLTDSKNGKLAAQGAVIINKTKDGQLVYNSGSTANPQTPSYNVVETPRGGQYHITLADGTRVWLNAASSLKYPAFFTGNERKVELTGEAYFEVVHNSKLPFRVVTSGQTVEDIGTYFNISAYNDEPAVSTTLLEGSVKVIKGQAAATLQPGQQAVTNQGGDNIDIKNADVGTVMAWKNGLFHFDHATLQSAMRQIARWYDVDVVYEGAIPKTVINGEAYRSMKASQVFEVLNYLKVKFRIEGKKIIVTNK